MQAINTDKAHGSKQNENIVINNNFNGKSIMIYNTKNDHLREQPGQMMLKNDYASSPVKASADALVEPTDKKRQYQEELAIQKENLMRKTE